MDERINWVAALANAAVYDEEATRGYIDGAPHLKHPSLRKLYGELLVGVYDFATIYTGNPNVLDLGAGEGSATLPFLELGARVTAVDISESQLSALRSRCERFGDRLQVRCEDINETLKSNNNSYDIIVVNSFLHHIPDYLGMIREAITLLTPHGQFFSFQDPLRHDSLGGFTTAFNKVAYFSWRVFRGDLVEGLKRRVRRSRGIYLSDCPADNVEYHAVRNGVDQEAITDLFEEKGFDCKIVCYFSTQALVFQHIGELLGMENTFSIIAQKRA
ncbi:MAG TPA: class I SAM-dependent methyltransferase [Thermodesulfobacteriota bacterium]|nr:class I SAM-dependent methyltransferase [Thermodesulfobacteriota bacterium]